MLHVLKFAPAAEVKRPAAGLGRFRRVLRAGLLEAAGRAVRLAARLEAVEAPAAVRGRVAPRPYVSAGAVGVRFVEAVVGLAVAAYFVAGLLGVFVA
jgi:hypothetical protein